MIKGTELGRYTIIRKIGSGGMGEVFLAHDAELDRNVALKLLPEEFCEDSERMKRFKQEARAASALNHPNIITIYEIGESGGRAFIVTEFVDGETLREKISRHELTLVESVKIAEQVASALSVAHAAHIVHRDIKPENIMIRRDGYVKILDFGLAKPITQESGAEDKTLQLVQTQAGMVMGSVRYMSPEQARGKFVDERTDIWSIGVVLYEMVTGKNPFDGETVSDSLAALIHVEPAPVDDLVEDAPEELNWIIRKTLKKKSDERYQNIKDLALDLKDLNYNLEHEIGFTTGRNIHNSTARNVRRYNSGENATLMIDNINSSEVQRAYTTGNFSAGHTKMFKTGNWILPVIILGLASVFALGAWFYLPSAKKDSQRFDALEITKLSDAATVYSPAISPDGKYIAYINSLNGKRSVAVRQVATGSNVQIVESPAVGILQFPVFSPDGNYVYYVVNDSGVGTLFQVPTLGGTAKKLIVDIDSKVTPSPDGKKLAFVRNNAETNIMSLLTANVDGSGEESVITSEQLKVKSFKEIGWSPEGNDLLIAAVDEIYGDDLVKSKLLLVSLADKSVMPFSDRIWYNVNSINWTKDNDNILFVGKSNEQEAAQIWELNYPNGANARRITNDSSGYIMMSLAREAGAIVGTKQDIISSLWLQDTVTKETTQLIAENKNFIGSSSLLQMSDGRLLTGKYENNKLNFYTLNAEGKDEKALTNSDAVNFQPAISPDNQYVVYGSTYNRVNGIWRMNINGGNPVQLTKPEGAIDSKPLVLPDNKTIVFERRLSEMSKSVLMKVSIDGGEAAALFDNSDEWGMFPRLSPDGKHFVYTAMEYDKANNKFNRYVRVLTVSGGEIGNLETQIDQNLGWNYRFSADAKNLTYVNMLGVQNLFNLPLNGGAPKQLTNFTSGIIMNFNWSNDGRKLYIVRGVLSNELVLLKDSVQKA